MVSPQVPWLAGSFWQSPLMVIPSGCLQEFVILESAFPHGQAGGLREDLGCIPNGGQDS